MLAPTNAAFDALARELTHDPQATAAWIDGPAAANRPLALGLGGVLVAAGLLALVLPDGAKPDSPPAKGEAPSRRRPGAGA